MRPSAPWLLLIHQLPPKPDYLRVKVRRRLQRLGAVLLKNSVYVLPNRPECLEDFQWLAIEIQAEGGDASVCTASFLSGVTDEQIAEAFTYTSGAPPVASMGSHIVPATRPRGATWVTRKDVFVDRMASAWLIRRFIDPEASFKFVEGDRYSPLSGEIRFDMARAEYTHEGDSCTFEVLVRRFQLTPPGIKAIAEIIHDIDLKEAKFGRPEAAGVSTIIRGIVASERDDGARIQQGIPLFEALLRQLKD